MLSLGWPNWMSEPSHLGFGLGLWLFLLLL